MISLVYNELYKSFRSKKTYLFIGILFILTAVISLFLKNIKVPAGFDPIMLEKLSGTMFPITFLSGVTDFLIPIFITLFVTSMISDEYQNGTFKLPLIHGMSRLEMFHAKLFSQWLLIIIIFASCLIFSYLFGIVSWGKEMINLNDFLKTIEVYGLTILPFMAFTVLTTFIGLKISNSGIVIGTIVAILVGSSVVAQFSKEINPYLITYYLKAFSTGLSNADQIKGCIVSLAYAIVFYLLSRFSLLKMDILK